MTNDDLGRLEQISKAADDVWPDADGWLDDGWTATEAKHIAANSPDVTLALIDRLREQDAEIAQLKDLLTVAAPMLCAECGPHVAIDEDGCCATCGADTTYITPPEKGARNTHD